MPEPAQILVAGRDRTAELSAPLAVLVREMEQRGASVFLPHDRSSLRLRDATSGPELMSLYAEQLRYRQHVDISTTILPPTRGACGWLINRVQVLLWRVMRYQHQRAFFRQNLINSHLLGLLEMQIRELRALRSEVESLRKGKEPS